MKNQAFLCVVPLVAAAACGSVSSQKPDASVADDASLEPIDAGAKACPAGVTALCEGDELITCDTEGNMTSTETCALGCESTENRCKKPTPSNGLAALYDEAAASTDFVLQGATTIDTDAQTIVDESGARVPLTSTVDANPVDLFVLKVKSFTTGGTVTVRGSRALVILSGGEVLINHDINVSARLGASGPGAVTTDLNCRGGSAGAANANGKAGGGGGAFATAGARGGNGGSPVIQGGAGGTASGNPELSPLRGGCPGGRASGASTAYSSGGGGGAIQIVSGKAITLGDGAAILANGTGGLRTSLTAPVCLAGNPCGQGEGGGAGGGILLEAPIVNMAATSGIFANGGAGSCRVDGGGQPGQRSTTPAAGQDCMGDTGDGGNGAAGLTNSTGGNNGSGTLPVGGGGGGGAGRLRVNLPLGTAFTPSGTISAVQSAGTLPTR